MAVYMDLFEVFDGDFVASCFASYIINAYSVLRETKIINGEEYKRLSDTFIMVSLIWVAQP